MQPRAKADRVAGRLGPEWKIQLKAPPVEGRANGALVEFLARGLGVPRAAVRIVAGLASRSKRVEVEGIAQQALERFLQGETG